MSWRAPFWWTPERPHCAASPSGTGIGPILGRRRRSLSRFAELALPGRESSRVAGRADSIRRQLEARFWRNRKYHEKANNLCWRRFDRHHRVHDLRAIGGHPWTPSWVGGAPRGTLGRDKNDGWHDYAAAAAFTIGFLRSRPVPFSWNLGLSITSSSRVARWRWPPELEKLHVRFLLQLVVQDGAVQVES